MKRLRLLRRAVRVYLLAFILGDYKGRKDCPYCGQESDLQEFLIDFYTGWVGPYDEANEPLVAELVERARRGYVPCEPCAEQTRVDGHLCKDHA